MTMPGSDYLDKLLQEMSPKTFGRQVIETISIGIPRMNPELAWMVAIFWIGRKT